MTRREPSHPLPGPQPGDVLDLTIHELGYGGVGVARHGSGLVCLVPRALPGEQVAAEVVKRKPRLAQTRLVGVRQESPQRVAAPCPHFATCGGCHLQHLAYTDQLAAKRAVLVRNLGRALGDGIAGKVADVVAAPRPLGYRNRSLYHVDGTRLGFVDPVAEQLVPIDVCLVADPASLPLVEAVRAWLAGAGRQLAGFVLDVLVRTSCDAAMVVLVVAAEDLDAAELCSWAAGAPAARLEPLRALARALAPAGVWLNSKPRAERATFGADFVHVAGPEHIVERVGPFALVLSPASFAQANPAIAALLYAHAEDRLAAAGERVLDLYCGSGALAFHLARSATSVYAVELDHRTLADARASAARNGIGNVTWRAGKCETIARKLVRDGERFRCASVNPPRTGLHEDLPAALVRLGVERLVYVSCSPPTLARDLGRLGDHGFSVVDLVPFDMFAQTYHLETVALLVRG